MSKASYTSGSELHHWGDTTTHWCCQGSGIEAFARLADSVFFQVNPRRHPSGRVTSSSSPPQLVLLQYISSRLRWNAQRVVLELHADTPGARASTEPLRTTLRVLRASGSAQDSGSQGDTSNGAGGGEREAATGVWVLWVRVPPWAEAASVIAEGLLSLPSRGEMGAHSGAPQGPVAVQPGTLFPVVFGGDAAASNKQASAALGTLRLQWGMGIHWERVQDLRPRFEALQAPMLGPLVLAGYTTGERAVSRAAALMPVPAVARRQLISLRLARAALGVASPDAISANTSTASSAAASPATACLVTRWGQAWVLYTDLTRSFLVLPPPSCIQRASPIGDEMSRWAQRSAGVGGGYRLSGAASRAACEQYEGCCEDGTSPFANGTLVLMHNGTDMPLVLASDPPTVPGTRKGGTDAANAATWRVTPAPLDWTTVAESASRSSHTGTSASESAPGPADWAVPIGSDEPVYLESFDAPGYVLSAATRDGSLYLRRAGTRGNAQRWRMVQGADGEGATVFQCAEAPGLVLSVEPLASIDGQAGGAGSVAVTAPLLHRGAFASRTSRLVLAPNRPSSPAAQLVRAPAPTEYPEVALWAKPSGSSGLDGDQRRDSFLMVPLNEIVDEHFSVYFCRVRRDQRQGGTEGSLPAFC